MSETNIYKTLRSSIWSKAAALGFIFLIVLANVWVAILVTGSQTPAWLSNSFMIGILLTFANVVALAVKMIITKFNSKKDTIDPDE